MLINIVHQLSNLLKYFGAFTIAFYLIPKHIFAQEHDSPLENVVSNFIKMVLLIIISGYILVILKIYEITTIFVILLYFWIRQIIIKNRLNRFSDVAPMVQIWMYDYVDKQMGIGTYVKVWLRDKKSQISKGIYGFVNSKFRVLDGIFAVSVFGYIIYLRFYDALKNAAPAMSDAYVTLAWMKYVGGRMLFHDGIYPQGFHIYLSFLNKISMIDELYVLKYTGPFNSALIAFGLFFIIYKASNRFISGISAAIIFGLMSHLLPGEVMRQASTNSQEFAFVFVLPVLYFAYKYVVSQKRPYFYSALTGMAVIGLTHSLAFVFLLIGLVALLIAGIVTEASKYTLPAIEMGLTYIFAGVIAVIPIGVGLIMGKTFHSTSADFLTQAVNQITMPPLSAVDIIAIVATFIMIFSAAFSVSKSTRLWNSFTVALMLLAFVLYRYGGISTKSVLIASRSGEFWALVVPVGIPAVLNVIFTNAIKKERTQIRREYILCALLLVATVAIIRPKPLVPYKMEHNENVEQYIRISSDLRPTEWLIVSQEEGYALTLGNGYHLMLREFIESYNPEYKRLVRTLNGNIDILYTKDVFIFGEKKIFKSGVQSIMESLKEVYIRKEEDNRLLSDWVERYRGTHDNLSVYFENENIVVYHIHQPELEDSERLKIWDDDKYKEQYKKN